MEKNIYKPHMARVIEAATQYAISKNHEYVTLEHLTYAMVTNETFKEMLISFGCDTDMLSKDIDQYIDLFDIYSSLI